MVMLFDLQVPARAAAAAAVARALSGLSPEQRFSLPSSSEELNSIYGSRPQTEAVPELEDEFYEEVFISLEHYCFNFYSASLIYYFIFVSHYQLEHILEGRYC